MLNYTEISYFYTDNVLLNLKFKMNLALHTFSDH